LNTSMIRRAQSFFFGLIQTLAFWDRPFIKSRVYVSGAVEMAFRRILFQSMYNLSRTINFFLVAYRLLPFVTDHFGSCVCVCQELEEPFRRCLYEYMYDPPHTIHFCYAAYRLLPVLTDLYWSGVRMCHGQVKRPSGDVYLNTCHNPFFLGRIQTSVFSDFFSCVCMCHGQLNRRSGDVFLNICIIRRA